MQWVAILIFWEFELLVSQLSRANTTASPKSSTCRNLVEIQCLQQVNESREFIEA